MFQDLDKVMQGSLAPYKKMIEVQTEMLERLSRQQIECTQACMKATIQQAMELQQVSNPQELTKLQLDYTHKLEEMVNHASEQNLNTLKEAHRAIEELTLKSMSGNS
ncbi:MAG TPA: phasin family protein [Marinobacterium sp.]|nr:phasin family protein [Marinobacterium sp.]